MERADYSPEMDDKRAIEIAAGMLVEYIREGWPIDLSYIHILQEAVRHNVRFDLWALHEITNKSLEALEKDE